MPNCQSCGGEYAEGAGFCPKCGAGVAVAEVEVPAGQAVAETAPAAWLADPTGRHELRYWDSREWTNHVSDGGVVSVEGEPQVAAQPDPEPAETVPPVSMSRAKRASIVVAVVVVALLVLGFGGLSVWRNGTPNNPLSSQERLMRLAPSDGSTGVLDITYDNEASALTGNYEFYETDHPSSRYEIWPNEVEMLVIDGADSADPFDFYMVIQGPEPLPGTVQFTNDGVSAMTVTTQE
jgi:hypothetical protein